MSPYDDGWMVGLDCRMVEHQLNHPGTRSVAAELAAFLTYRDVVLKALPAVDEKVEAATSAALRKLYDRRRPTRRKLTR